LLRYGDILFFQNGGRQPSWICYVHVWTTQDEYFIVFANEQNLVGIDAVVSHCKCLYNEFDLKMPINAQIKILGGILPPE